jgi:thioredoxin 1
MTNSRLLLVWLLVTIACKGSNQDDSVLASVNGSTITHQQFTSELRNLPEESMKHFQNDRVGLLEQLITRELLFQEAVRRAATERSEWTGESPEARKSHLIKMLIDQELRAVTVTEEELRHYYSEHKDQFRQEFESVRTQVTDLVLQRKQNERYDALVQGLRSSAVIERNKKWVVENTPGNPLDRVLGKGSPVLADFGRGVCVPCKKMKPILEEVKREYESRAHVLIVETSKHRALTRQYRIRLIPTQIFFDREGNEHYRHEGFMPKEEIVARLDELLNQ